MGKFNLGDIIVGNSSTRGAYSITNEKAKCIVVENGVGYIQVRVLEHERKEYIGMEFDVDEEKFDLVSLYKPLVGEHVLIKTFDKRPRTWNFDGLMDKYMGTVQTVSVIDDCGFYIAAATHENDGEGWVFNFSDASPVIDEEFEKRFESARKKFGEEEKVLYTVFKRGDDTFVREGGAEGREAKLGAAEKDSIVDAAKTAIFDLDAITCRVVCIESTNGWWIVGKIYEIKNGTIYDEDGDSYRHIKSVEDLNDYVSANFIKIVE